MFRTNARYWLGCRYRENSLRSDRYKKEKQDLPNRISMLIEIYRYKYTCHAHSQASEHHAGIQLAQLIKSHVPETMAIAEESMDYIIYHFCFSYFLYLIIIYKLSTFGFN